MNITGRYLNDMEEKIYDEEVLKENLEEIENMTVKEIRRGLREGYGFFIFGDSSWAILEADKAKRDIKMAENLSFSFDISTETKEKLMELLAPDGVETIYIEKVNGELFPVANIERHPDCPKHIYEAWKRSIL